MISPKIIVLVTMAATLTMAQQELACATVPAGQFARSSDSCQAYYFCDGRKAIAAKCPTNYLFNAKTQMCDHPTNVDCNQCSSLGIQHLPDPNSCTGYLQCVNGQQSHVECPPRLVFDPTVGDCNHPKATDVCTRSICSSFEELMRIGDPQDCTYYFTCLSGRAYRKSCAPGLMFNAYIGQCMVQAEDGRKFCQDDGPIIIPSSSQHDHEATSSVSKTESIKTNEIPIFAPKYPLWDNSVQQVPTTSKEQSEDFKSNKVWRPQAPVIGQNLSGGECPLPNGAFKHPYSCTKFIRCTKGAAQVIDCRVNYYWHQNQRRCSPQKPADC